MDRMYDTMVRAYRFMANRRRCFFFLLLLLPFAILFPMSNRSYTSEGGRGHFHLQRTADPSEWDRIVRSWTSPDLSMETVVQNYRRHLIQLDLVFPVAYVLFVMSAVALLTSRTGEEPGGWDLLLFVLPILGGLFDWAENLKHIQLLQEALTLGGFDNDTLRAGVRQAFAFTVLKLVLAFGPLVVAVIVWLSMQARATDRKALEVR